MQDNDNKDELLHLKSKIKDIGISSFRLYNKKDHWFEKLSKGEYEAFINLKNKLVKSLHWKKTFSGVYMSSSSFLSLKCKKGLIYTLLFQAFNICADYNTFHKKVQYLKLIRQKNSFLHFFIDSCIKRFLDKLFITHKMSDSVTNKKEIFICLEFLWKISF